MNKTFFLLLFSLPSLSLALDPRFDRWAQIREPSTPPSQILGFYSAGCLSGAAKFDQDSSGHAVMRLSRNRRFGHPDLIHYLQTLSHDLHHQGLPLLLIGDMSPPRGGPMANGHNSHQTGLDVDLWLRMSARRPNASQRESWTATSYVRNRKTLLKNWGTTQARLVATAAAQDGVNRIFVAPAIKKYFCEHQPKAPWLYRLRAWWGHEEHIHVRLNCPAGSTTCQVQDPLNPNDNGCGEELAWWFSKEADDDWEKLKGDTSERQFPNLPPACESLVN